MVRPPAKLYYILNPNNPNPKYLDDYFKIDSECQLDIANRFVLCSKISVIVGYKKVFFGKRSFDEEEEFMFDTRTVLRRWEHLIFIPSVL